MAAIINFLCLVFFLSLVGKGTCQCIPGQLEIAQAKTGVVVQNKPEWNVTITNQCPCSQLDINLVCNGFQSVKKMDPFYVAKSGNECLINYGQPIYAHSTFNFTYAWDAAFPFKFLSSQIACS